MKGACGFVAVGAAAFLSGSGCVTGSPGRPEVSPREPVRWVVAEKRVGELYPGGRHGDGRLDPAAPILVFEPIAAEGRRWVAEVESESFFVELLGISPCGPVAPGEVVSARVRVGNAAPGAAYRLSAVPTTPEVTLLGASELVVHGGAEALFRFTSRRPGRAGISVSAARLKGTP